MSKKILLQLLFLVVCAAFAFALKISFPALQEENWRGYVAEWKTADSLESQGLPRSAMDILEKIITHAREENNDPQLAHAILAKSKILTGIDDGGLANALRYLIPEADSEQFPVSNLLDATLAYVLESYVNAHWDMLANRLPVPGTTTGDISTWDIKTFQEKARQYLMESLGDPDTRRALQKIPVIEYDSILDAGNVAGRFMRPTLFDLLAHQAIDFMIKEIYNVSSPGDQLVFTDTRLFADNKEFARADLKCSCDSMSRQYLLPQILQELTRMHLADPYPAALIDLDLKRFDIAHDHYNGNDPDSLFLRALHTEENKYMHDTSAANIYYKEALYYFDKARTYVPLTDTEYRWDDRAAILICDSVLRKYPNTSGARACLDLRENITKPFVKITTENINLPDQPFRALVGWKNMQGTWVRIYKTSFSTGTLLRGASDKDIATYLRKRTPVKTWYRPLPDSKDFQEHSVEIPVASLPAGSYYIAVSGDSSFSQSDSDFAFSGFYVSGLCYLMRNNAVTNDTGSVEVYILNRSTGEPVPGAGIRMVAPHADILHWKYTESVLSTGISDKDGYAKLVMPFAHQPNMQLFIRKGDDTLAMGTNIYPSVSSLAGSEQVNTLFFTDRGIYRPGQIVYFKGIMIRESADRKSKAVIPDTSTNVQLIDVNGQIVASADLVTDQDGSFAGTFALPANCLTGEFYLRNASGYCAFSVENYKRPDFEIHWDPIHGDHVLNDTITTSGNVKTYSGASVDHAAVSYRVFRNAFYPFFYSMDYILPPRRDQPVMIVSGNTFTDANGVFPVSFPAMPDAGINKDYQPVYSYTIFADVTDNAGETQSGSMTVNVGSVGMIPDAQFPESAPQDSVLQCIISVKNVNGEPVPASGALEIFQLKSPDRLFRERLWDQPDTFVLTRNEYYKAFPHDLYDNENDVRSWTVLSALRSVSWKADGTDTLDLPTVNWPAGMYKAVLKTEDSRGTKMEINRYFTVKKSGSGSVYPKYLYAPQTEFIAAPGQSLQLAFYSSAKDMHALFTYAAGNGNMHSEWTGGVREMNTSKNENSAQFEIPVRESDRGGCNAYADMIKDNCFYHIDYHIDVPWDNKKLHLAFETFRNKLMPGDSETWKINVTGYDGETVDAEMLVSMYDASLDIFRPVVWPAIAWPQNYFQDPWSPGSNFAPASRMYSAYTYAYVSGIMIEYDFLDIGRLMYEYHGNKISFIAMQDVAEEGQTKEKSVPGVNENVPADTIRKRLQLKPPRKNLRETAFFYPQLHTDSSGAVTFSFTMPESLTRWKCMAFAHTKSLQSGSLEQTLVTQKPLMITPNAPRFFREGDSILFTASIRSFSDTSISGTAVLMLFDAATMVPLDSAFSNRFSRTPFTVKAGQSASAAWRIHIPAGHSVLRYRVLASAGDFTDGEENAIPVLSNRILVTETLPMEVFPGTSRSFTMLPLLQTGNAADNYAFSIEYSANPSWYAVRALPYLAEYPYDCSEQIFERYFANRMAAYIVQENPGIENVFHVWQNTPGALQSPLAQNPDLKSILLQLTPWVQDAQDETQRMQDIALLFDTNTMQYDAAAELQKLSERQNADGGFPWFGGGSSDRYITQYIAAGLARLEALTKDENTNADLKDNILSRALHYCDAQVLDAYNDMLRNTKPDTSAVTTPEEDIQYLYLRSFLRADVNAQDDNLKEAIQYFYRHAVQHKTEYGLYAKGMLALIAYRSGDTKISDAILRSLQETAINDPSLGMYWKENSPGFYWYTAPVETQALMMEVFEEAGHDEEAVNALRLWLLQNKHTNNWGNTRATAEACYAIIMTGGGLPETNTRAKITLGGTPLNPPSAEAGTGYFRQSWTAGNFTSDFSHIDISDPGPEAGYGAAYWQHFVDMDKMAPSASPLKIQKEIFLKRDMGNGQVLVPLDSVPAIHVGDLLTVRIIIRSDRDLEYVHMKDLRASLLEPVSTLSGYRWQGGLGYYETPGDASEDFFFDRLPAGIYVFAYDLRVAHAGNCSNGFANIECMYAPEFSARSMGLRLQVH